MIEAQGLSRRYGDFTAVDDVSFSVDEGEIVGILGPNGAGKTTTIRMVTGFLPPTEGRLTVAGHDLLAAPRQARREIGYLPENVALYPEMRVAEYLAYRASLEGMGRGAAGSAIDEALERCLIADVKDQIIGTLSKGYRQRVGLAMAILHQPSVLVLDEPTVGLDPKQIIAIRELIRELGERRTLLLSTHILPEVELLCQRVLIIDQGRLIDQGTPAELRQRWRGDTALDITVKGAAGGAEEALAGLDGVRGVILRQGEDRPGDAAGAASEEGTAVARLRLRCDPERDLREEVFRLAVARGWVLLELAERKASLEDIFVRLTTRDVAEEAAEEAVEEETVEGTVEEGTVEEEPADGPAETDPDEDGGRDEQDREEPS